jgi:hypothetical protein
VIDDIKYSFYQITEGLEFVGSKNFLFSTSSRMVLGPNQPLGGPFSRGKTAKE